MSRAIEKTLLDLESAAKKSDGRVLVSYSGGKDSLATLDLCLRSFKQVECFFMYFVPGLRCVEEMLDYARKRWGVTIRQYPHWVLRNALDSCAFTWNRANTEDLPDWKLSDVHQLAMAETGMRLVATGARRGDSAWRRWQLARKQEHALYPIVEWNKADVLGYLNARRIPIPSSSGRSATGIGLETPSLLWLHDTYPDDFAKLLEIFPFAESVVWRRRWYGVT